MRWVSSVIFSLFILEVKKTTNEEEIKENQKHSTLGLSTFNIFQKWKNFNFYKEFGECKG